MSKIYNGTIVILKPKTNSGIIVLEDGEESRMIKFNSIFNDKDQVIATFKDNNPLNELLTLSSCDQIEYKGFVLYPPYNSSHNGHGEVISTYPKSLSGIHYVSQDVATKFADLEIGGKYKVILKQRRENGFLVEFKDYNNFHWGFIPHKENLEFYSKKMNDFEWGPIDEKILLNAKIIDAYLDKDEDRWKIDLTLDMDKKIKTKNLKIEKTFQPKDQAFFKTGDQISFKISKDLKNNYIHAKNIKRLDKGLGMVFYGRIIKDNQHYFLINKKNCVDSINLDKYNPLNESRHPEIGAVYQCRIKNIGIKDNSEFGVFAEFLPGYDGLIHRSEISWYGFDRIEDEISMGTTVYAKLIDEREEGKYSLSIKQLHSKPWHKKVKVKKEDFVNFTGIDKKGIYYQHLINGKSEVYKLDENNSQDLIGCYRADTTEDEIRYQIINKLIEFDINTEKFSKETLKKERLELYKRMINNTPMGKKKRKLIIELTSYINEENKDALDLSWLEDEMFNKEQENISLEFEIDEGYESNNKLNIFTFEEEEVLDHRTYDTEKTIKEIIV